MQSPPIEWSLWIGTLIALDWIRARGEADNDTLSECIRDAVARHPRGVVLFDVGLAASALVFRSHIVKPLRRHP